MSDDTERPEEELTPEERQAIAMGEEAKLFLVGPLGLYLKDMADLHVEDAKSALASVDPEDTKLIRHYQQIIARHGDFDQWIYDLIQLGDQTYETYLANVER